MTKTVTATPADSKQKSKPDDFSSYSQSSTPTVSNSKQKSKQTLTESGTALWELCDQIESFLAQDRTCSELETQSQALSNMLPDAEYESARSRAEELLTDIDTTWLNQGCGISYYSLITHPSPGKGGSVTTSPSQPEEGYEEGTTITVTATPSSGWNFDHFEIDTYASSTENPYSFNINSDTTITAFFVEERYKVTGEVSPSESGTIGLDPAQPEDGYTDGTQVTATAMPNSGWEFDHFSVPPRGSISCSSPWDFYVHRDLTLTAHFAKTSYILSFEVSGCVFNAQPSLGDTEWSPGSKISLIVVWNPGYQLSSVSGENAEDLSNLTDSSMECANKYYHFVSATLIMDSDKEITFEAETVEGASSKQSSQNLGDKDKPNPIDGKVKNIPIDVLIPLADGQTLRKDVLTALLNQEDIPFRILTRTRPKDKTDRIISIVENRNALTKLASSPIVFLLDSDVLLPSTTTIADCVSFLSNHTDFAACAVPTDSSVNSPVHLSLQATAVRLSVLKEFPFWYDGKGCECYNFASDLRNSGWKFGHLPDCQPAKHLSMHTFSNDDSTLENDQMKLDFHKLTIKVEPDNAGETSPPTGEHEITADSTVQVFPSGKENYVFSHWSGDYNGTLIPAVFTVNQDFTITANFSKEKSTVTATIDSSTTTATADGKQSSTIESLSSLDFCLAYRSWKGQFVIRYGRKGKDWIIMLKDDDKVHEFHCARSPLEEDTVSATYKVYPSTEFFNFEGNIPAEHPINPLEEIPISQTILDEGTADIAEQSEDFWKVEFHNDKLSGLFTFHKSGGGLWIVEKSETP